MWWFSPSTKQHQRQVAVQSVGQLATGTHSERRCPTHLRSSPGHLSARPPIPRKSPHSRGALRFAVAVISLSHRGNLGFVKQRAAFPPSHPSALARTCKPPSHKLCVYVCVCVGDQACGFLCSTAKVSRPGQACVRALEVTERALINQLCGHVSPSGEGSVARLAIGVYVCAPVRVRACPLTRRPDVSHI